MKNLCLLIFFLVIWARADQTIPLSSSSCTPHPPRGTHTQLPLVERQRGLHVGSGQVPGLSIPLCGKQVRGEDCDHLRVNRRGNNYDNDNMLQF